MTEQEVMKFCHYYKGEAIVPLSFEQKYEHALWLAEKYICEELFNQIEEENPRRYIADIIASYVSKWMPYEFGDIMNVYWEKVPDLKADIMLCYN